MTFFIFVQYFIPIFIMKDLVENINALCSSFIADAQKNVEGNKSH